MLLTWLIGTMAELVPFWTQSVLHIMCIMLTYSYLLSPRLYGRVGKSAWIYINHVKWCSQLTFSVAFIQAMLFWHAICALNLFTFHLVVWEFHFPCLLPFPDYNLKFPSSEKRNSMGFQHINDKLMSRSVLTFKNLFIPNTLQNDFQQSFEKKMFQTLFPQNVIFKITLWT